MAEKISFPACYDPASGQKGEILGTLGITLLPPEGSGRDTVVRAEMPVDDRTAQCYGYLSGSAMLAVEEALAGFGSTRLVPDGYKPVGTSVTANHVHRVGQVAHVHGVARAGDHYGFQRVGRLFRK